MERDCSRSQHPNLARQEFEDTFHQLGAGRVKRDLRIGSRMMSFINDHQNNIPEISHPTLEFFHPWQALESLPGGNDPSSMS
jgi:hypothetical protein